MMKVLVAMDGSEYGKWGLDWVATLPFVKPPRVTTLHVRDSAWLRLPFRTKLEGDAERDGFLVAGSKGLDALDRFLLGSVSTKLIHYARCPVLVVKGRAVP